MKNNEERKPENTPLADEELTAVTGGFNIDATVKALGEALYTCPALKKACNLYKAKDWGGFLQEMFLLIAQGNQVAKKAAPYLK